ncbi:hypothetical protein [Aneurinibacillus terranovensis]|uniref:hypothetical protein n=1 Tax=Aneurinibacillus terranovensis TaxID=278991 RepID=UPI00041E6A17
MKHSFLAKRSNLFLFLITIMSLVIFSFVFMIMLSIMNVFPHHFISEWPIIAGRIVPTCEIIGAAAAGAIGFYFLRKYIRRRIHEKGTRYRG